MPEYNRVTSVKSDRVSEVRGLQTRNGRRKAGRFRFRFPFFLRLGFGFRRAIETHAEMTSYLTLLLATLGIMIGSWTDHDHNLAALQAIRAEWASAGTLDQRIDHIHNGKETEGMTNFVSRDRLEVKQARANAIAIIKIEIEI